VLIPFFEATCGYDVDWCVEQHAEFRADVE